MTATLLALRDAGGRDFGKGRAFLTWHVDLNEIVVRSDPVAVGLPAQGSLYPFPVQGQLIPMVLDSWVTEPVPEFPDHTFATAVYSNDRSARLDPREDSTAIGFKDWSFRKVTMEHEMPSVIFKPIRPVTGTSTDFEPEIKIGKVTESVIVRERMVTVNNVTSTDLNLIRDADNAVFLISGRAYRMETGISTGTIERGVHQITYSLFDDPGTPPNFAQWVTLQGTFTGPALILSSAPVKAFIEPNATSPDDPYIYYPGAPSNRLNVILPGFSDGAQYTRSPFCTLEVVITRTGAALFPQLFRYKVGTQNQLIALPGSPFP